MDQRKHRPNLRQCAGAGGDGARRGGGEGAAFPWEATTLARQMFPAYRAEYSNVMWGDSTSSPAGGLELGHLAADPMGWLIVGRQAPGPQPAPGTPTCPWHLELDSLAHSESRWARGAPTLCWPVLLQTPHSAGLGHAACDFEGARGLCTQRWGSPEGGALNWVLIKASGESLAGWRMSVGEGKPASLIFTTFSRNSAPPSGAGGQRNSQIVPCHAAVVTALRRRPHSSLLWNRGLGDPVCC